MLVTGYTVSSESLECGINDGESGVMSSAGINDEYNHNAAGITAVPVYLNGVSAVIIAVGVDYYYYFGVRCARLGESEDTLSVQRPQPHTTNPWKEEKDKTVGDKNERADHANRKALANS